MVFVPFSPNVYEAITEDKAVDHVQDLGGKTQQRRVVLVCLDARRVEPTTQRMKVSRMHLQSNDLGIASLLDCDLLLVLDIIPARASDFLRHTG